MSDEQQAPERDRLVKTFAYEYVMFNHDPNHCYLVTDVTDDCMLEIEGMSGQFAPSCFRLAPTPKIEPTSGADGRYCAHHDDDPAHGEECYESSERLVDEVQRRMDQVVEAAVEWHQSDENWAETADRLASAINSLLELRGDSQTAMPRRWCSVHEREEFKYESLEHELQVATPASPVTALSDNVNKERRRCAAIARAWLWGSLTDPGVPESVGKYAAQRCHGILGAILSGADASHLAGAEGNGEMRIRRREMTSERWEELQVALDRPTGPTDEEAEEVLQACGTSGKEVVNEFIERLLKENLELKQKLAAKLSPPSETNSTSKE